MSKPLALEDEAHRLPHRQVIAKRSVACSTAGSCSRISARNGWMSSDPHRCPRAAPARRAPHEPPARPPARFRRASSGRSGDFHGLGEQLCPGRSHSARRGIEHERGLGDRRAGLPRHRPIFCSSCISGDFVCSRPAVSMIGTSEPLATADFTASNTTEPGSAPRSCETRCAPARTAQTSSCSPAAARNSVGAGDARVRPSPTRRLASLPIVVVFPDPLTPTGGAPSLHPAGRAANPGPGSRPSPRGGAIRHLRRVTTAHGPVPRAGRRPRDRRPPSAGGRGASPMPRSRHGTGGSERGSRGALVAPARGSGSSAPGSPARVPRGDVRLPSGRRRVGRRDPDGETDEQDGDEDLHARTLADPLALWHLDQLGRGCLARIRRQVRMLQALAEDSWSRPCSGRRRTSSRRSPSCASGA